VVGQAKIRSGDVLLEGRSIAGLAPHTLPARGMGYVPQLDSVFATLSVEENLRLGLYLDPGAWAERRDAMLAQFPVLKRLWRKRADDLSGGERKLVAVARALMMQPRVLLFDEPSAGLSPARQDELFDLIDGIHRSGVTVVIVEQNARQCLEICDRGYVLDRGANAFVGPADALLNDEKVVALYLGSLYSNRAASGSPS
ncbi:ABC transporter ATP-binding protein, partial [Vineibacter terrae]|uniref:ABC transporter ATP-binding protein n=1 Tax=Vineibacter terrae TaxID=2586908 RepID=UPI002E33E123